MNDRVWKIFFAIAAATNFAVGLPVLFLPGETLDLFGMAQPPTLLFLRFTGGSVALFGCYYAIVARDLARRELVWLGIIGKLFAVTLFTIYWRAGELPDLPYELGLGDLVFAAIFLWFLLSHRRAAT
ncbi:MAG: hypothetical protein GC190_01150 [Alphaproteobacteria bacterium]|nr:hypothetical protein [Alphaproteobacteria bacterium]